MPNRILVNEGWEDRVRDRLGVEKAYLPDTTLLQPDCITLAEANIIKAIPSYEAATGDINVFLEAAVVLECCILLCPGMPSRLPKKQTGPHEGHELSTDWLKKKQEFEEERNRYIGDVLADLDPSFSPASLNRFIVTYPRRW